MPATTERLADRVDVDAEARALGETALEQVRDADGELNDLDAALDVTEGVGVGLAVFRELSRVASSSAFWLTRSMNFIMTRARRCRFQAAQPRCACTAVATAADTSSADASGTHACVVPVLGSRTSAWRPSVTVTAAPFR